jgi:hypothetical protein
MKIAFCISLTFLTTLPAFALDCREAALMVTNPLAIANGFGGISDIQNPQVTENGNVFTVIYDGNPAVGAKVNTYEVTVQDISARFCILNKIERIAQ